MKKCKITVLKKYFDKELSQQYGVDGLTACPMLKTIWCRWFNSLSNVKRRTRILRRLGMSRRIL